MGDTQTRQMVRQAISQLVAGLEEGQSNHVRACCSAMARFPAYSFGNVLLIRSQCPEASRVAGFCTWRRLGRHVRRGERGIRILVPIVFGNGERQEDIEQGVACRTGYVFDIGQTDGRSLPELTWVGSDPCRYLDRLRAAFATHGIDLEYLETPAGVRGWSAGGRVVIRRGLLWAEEFSTMVHELAYELLHRDGQARREKAARETEAEAVAFVVCEAIGLDTTKASPDYVQLWNGDRAMLLASLDRIHRAAATVLDDLGIGQEAGEPLSISVQRPAA